MRPQQMLTAAVLIALSALPATAREACVRCDGPFAVYRCVIDDAMVPPDASIHLVCITQLAKQNGHRTCGVDSAAAQTACSGEVVAVAPPPDFIWPPSPPPSFAASPDEPANTADEPADSTANAQDLDNTQPSGPPKTVEELAKQTAVASKKGLETAGEAVGNAGEAVVGAAETAAKKTGQTLEKTGNAIGNAAKKTWRCLSSLFGNC